MRILIKNVSTVLPDGKTELTNIMIDGDKITSIGEVPVEFQPARVIDGTDKLAIPGFVNSHTHTPMTLLRCYGDDMALMDWLNKKIWPIEAKMKSDDIYWGSMMAAVEMIRTGTTGFADMYSPYLERIVEMVIDSGLRGALAYGMIGAASDSDKKLAENTRLFETYNGAGDGRVKIMYGPHAPYTCPPEFLKKVAVEAQKHNAEVHIHMSETLDELDFCQKEYNKRPFAYVEETGLFENGTLAAHCVWLEDEDIDIIKRHNIRVAHNPISNMKLASGVSPVPRLLDEGVCVGLATDGTSSNNNLDMIEETRVAALIHKVHNLDAVAVPSATALKLGTEYSSKAVGLVENGGRLEAGAVADIVLLDLTNSTAWRPVRDRVSQLVYAANSSSVDTVLVAGKVLMEKRELKTLDEERIYFEAEKAAERITR